MKIGETKTVAVAINTGGVAINAAQATVTYPGDKLEVVSVSKGGIFTLWTSEPSYSSSTISFSGGVASPGYSGHGTIISITFKARANGSAVLSVVGGKILANDGLGTNIYGGAAGATYNIAAQTLPPPVSVENKAKYIKPEETLTEEEKTTAEKTLPSPMPITINGIQSEQKQWYNNDDGTISFDPIVGATRFSWSYDDKLDTVPDDTVEGTNNVAELPNSQDGIWYFHVKSGNDTSWGETRHYTIMIDNTPPKVFTINLNADSITKNRRPTFNFYTADETSGIDFYTVLVDSQVIFAKITPAKLTNITLDEQSYGEHTITVLALDKAGNVTDAKTTITIVEQWPGVGFYLGIIFITYYWLAIVLFILLIIVLVYLWIFGFIHKRRSVHLHNHKNTKTHTK
jgi:hypothetical protein